MRVQAKSRASQKETKRAASRAAAVDHVRPGTDFESDYQCYVTFRKACAGMLASSDLDEIWLAAKDAIGEGSFREKYDLALVFAGDRVSISVPSAEPAEHPPHPAPDDEPKPKPKPTPKPNPTPKSKSSIVVDSPTTPVISLPDTPFGSFARLFADFIPLHRLQELWDDLDHSIGAEDRQEIAAMYAMDLLVSEHTLHFAKRKPLRAAKQRKHTGRPTYMTDQEAAVVLIDAIFEGEALDATTKRLALLDRGFDVEAATAFLCNHLLRKGCFIRPDVSFAEVTGGSSAVPWSRPSPASSTGTVLTPAPASAPASAPAPLTGVCITSSGATVPVGGALDHNTEETAFVLTPLLLGSPQFKLGVHFLQVFRKNNPHVRCAINQHSELVYQGTQQHYQRVHERDLYVLSVSVDLHGLFVQHSLQLVDSCLDHYYSHLDSLSFSATKRQILLTFVVGKGLHSANGVARIGPAVARHLRSRGEANVAASDGQISVHLRL